MNPWFAAAYLILGGTLLTVELVGVARKQPGDTITEGWRSLDRRLRGAPQWTYRVMTVGVLLWTALHLAGVW